ncbi:hypothetical protein CVT24_004409 [Panaeolus cyanescens]|uniref:Uncharacterized protein n=1 Tax=Panaeolus cyanescens TaxID=181874 RepID=A0A409YBJ2_9AGAR|nr:hypothetical protein CVT24_004409 [Panaeolus cyanescens]
MDICPASSIPQITFASYSQKPVASVYSGSQYAYGRPQRLDVQTLRVLLRDILDKNYMFRSPAGFPFASGQTSLRLPHAPVDMRAPYAFQETIPMPDPTQPSVTVVISYTPPYMCPSRKLSWKIHTCQGDPSPDTPNGRITLAQVELDPIILETTYGSEILTNPHILLSALARSVILSALITVSVATTKTGHMNVIGSKLAGSVRVGDYIFMATFPNGQTQLAYVYGKHLRPNVQGNSAAGRQATNL